MRGQGILCAALAAVLVFSGYQGGDATAASGKPIQTSGTPAVKMSAEQAQAATEKAPAGTEPTGEEPVAETPDGVEGMAEELTEAELAEYYGDSVFIGDSIMLGFRNYSAKAETYVHGIQFLAVGSYSAFNALKPVEGKNVHPMYKGEKYQLWEAVPLTDSKRAFILLGMNDISLLGLEGARDAYIELIEKVLETSPDMEIHIVSVTYTLKDEGKKKLNNDNIAKYNVLLQEMARENGWGYIDLCTPISDGEGNLAAECCSDGFVHLSNSAYAIWEKELIRYANERNLRRVIGTVETAEEMKQKMPADQ